MSKKRWLWLAVIALVALGIYWSRGREQTPSGEDASLVFNRVWVDSKPKRDTDYVQVFVALTKLPIGLFQKASSYRFVAERFDYRRKAKQLAIHFPQNGREATISYRVRACNELPPYDLCLDLLSKNPWGGPQRYYGMREQKRASDTHSRLRQRVLDALQQQ